MPLAVLSVNKGVSSNSGLPETREVRSDLPVGKWASLKIQKNTECMKLVTDHFLDGEVCFLYNILSSRILDTQKKMQSIIDLKMR